MEILKVVPGTKLEGMLNRGESLNTIIDQIVREAGYNPSQVRALMIDIPDPALHTDRPTQFVAHVA